MKLIVNGRFFLHRTTGVERYAREILNELDKLVEDYNVEIAVPPSVTETPVYKNISVVKVGKLNNRLWEHISFPRYVKKQKAISLNLCNVAPIVKPDIVCIFDAKIKIHPEFFSKSFLLWYKLLFWNAMKRSKLIFTDSYSARNDLIKYYNTVNKERIKVVYPSWQHFLSVSYDENTLTKYGLENNKFYFAMGSMEPNKNFKWIAGVAKKNPSIKFAIAGAVNEKVFKDGLGFEPPDNMKFLGYVSDSEAKTLMRDCYAFLFPTYYEGFGMPPLEAVSAGANRLVVSDSPVMHEIFNDQATYINPDIYELPLHIEKNDYEKILVKYSWRESANEMFTQLKKYID